MAKVIIFGTKDFAQLAYFYLARENCHEIVGFTAHRDFNIDTYMMNLPVIPFEDIESCYPPKQFKLFAPMSPKKMNSVRQDIYEEIKSKGYQLISYISPHAIYYDTEVGENCFIFENNVIQPYAKIGNNVIMWSGNHLGHHSIIGDNCFIASHAVISGHVTIEQNSFIGVNATINNGVIIARNTFVGSGALITQNTQAFGVYPGSPAELSRVPSNRIRNI